MSYCITDIEHLGCFTNCDELTLGFNATSTGTYTLEYHYLESIVREEFEAADATEIIIPNIFNEFADATFRILDENGDPVIKSTKEFYSISFSLNGSAC